MEEEDQKGKRKKDEELSQIMNTIGNKAPNCTPPEVYFLVLVLCQILLREYFIDGCSTSNEHLKKAVVENKMPKRVRSKPNRIMTSIQLGIKHVIGDLASEPECDLLMKDFQTSQKTTFPTKRSHISHSHAFVFKNYAPLAFRYFRDLLGLDPHMFLQSLCGSPLKELANPGASGSIFYLTGDDNFIMKTVQYKEGKFLRNLFAFGYCLNLVQNPKTLLPKFFAMYRYQCNTQKIRLVIMDNLLPSTIVMDQKYDLKGSTYKRKASEAEQQKTCPTYKDLDFVNHHPGGILLETGNYKAVTNKIQRDCRVLESFGIMDYSLLLAIHNLSQGKKKFEDLDEDVVSKGIRARNANGEDLLLFIGIIDILQSYTLVKKLEHFWKSLFQDGNAVSVQTPSYYGQRFQKFMVERVFKESPCEKCNSSSESYDDLDGNSMPVVCSFNKTPDKSTFKYTSIFMGTAFLVMFVGLIVQQPDCILLYFLFAVGPIFFIIKILRAVLDPMSGREDEVVFTTEMLKFYGKKKT